MLICRPAFRQADDPVSQVRARSPIIVTEVKSQIFGLKDDSLVIISHPMITSHQMKAARALLGIDQRGLSELADVSLPTIQRMESSDGQVRGVMTTVMKVITAIEAAGVELLGEHANSVGVGRGVRLRETTAGRVPSERTSVLYDKSAPAGVD